MKISKGLQQAEKTAQQRDSYWVERAKLQFAVALEQQRKSAGLSYSELAKKLVSSAAYISKVFRGDSNLTIESMVKLARATGAQVKIELVHTATKASAPEAAPERRVPSTWTTTAPTAVTSPVNAQGARIYAWPQGGQVSALAASLSSPSTAPAAGLHAHRDRAIEPLNQYLEG